MDVVSSFVSRLSCLKTQNVGVLNERGRLMVDGEESSFLLSLRLKITKEIANALAYLHT